MHQVDHRLVPFAVKGRENKDQQADHHAAHEPFAPQSPEAGKRAADSRIDACEVVRHEPAQRAQDDVERDVVQAEGLDLDAENRLEAVEEKHQRGGRDRRNEQRDDRAHRNVEHQDFEHEDDARDRRLEHGRKGARRTAAEQQRDVPVVEPHELADVRADGRTGQHDRRLGADRTAETDSRRAGHHRRIAVVRLDAGALFAHRIEYARHPFGDVVAHPVAHEKRREDHADDRVDQVERAGRVDRQPTGQPGAHQHQQPFEEVGREACGEPDDDGQQNHQLLLREPLRRHDQVAVQQPEPPVCPSGGITHLYCCILHRRVLRGTFLIPIRGAGLSSGCARLPGADLPFGCASFGVAARYRREFVSASALRSSGVRNKVWRLLGFAERPHEPEL